MIGALDAPGSNSAILSPPLKKPSSCSTGSLLLASCFATESIRPPTAYATDEKIEIPPLAHQIAGAVLAAPTERREGARVLAYGPDGQLQTVRQGNNDLVCLADDPRQKGFHVACYHRDLEPYMARGRALRAQGIHGEKNRKTRWKEVDDGKLPMPRQPKTVYVLSGNAFDAARGLVEQPHLRWVLYAPYATPESTGLSLSPRENGPWLMLPGTAGAHIMINPPAMPMKH